jgi:hypothetical protein
MPPSPEAGRERSEPSWLLRLLAVLAMLAAAIVIRLLFG